MKNIRVASLFAGIGGFELGLEYASIPYENVFVSEIDNFAQKSYVTNFKTSQLVGDITKIREGDVPDHDMLFGGFPCQAFSIAGKRNGFEDTRGTLFFDIMRILLEKRPKYFVLENVKNLVSHDNSNTMRVILDSLTTLDYAIDFTVINAKEAGVPQNRERTFFVGVRNHDYEKYKTDNRNSRINSLKSELNRKGNFHSFNFFDTLSYSNRHLSLKDILHKGRVDNKYYLETNSVRSFLDGLDLSVEQSKLDRTKINKLFDIPRDVHLDHERQRRVYSVYGISPTVLARSDTSKILLKEEGVLRIRKVTPYENFRIQGYDHRFTERIIRHSGNSNTQLYKQSGNAVSPIVVEGIVKKLMGVRL